MTKATLLLTLTAVGLSVTLLLPSLAYTNSLDGDLKPCPNIIRSTDPNITTPNKIEGDYGALLLKMRPGSHFSAIIFAKCKDGQINPIFSPFTSKYETRKIIYTRNIKELVITPKKGRNKRSFILDQNALANNDGKICTLIHKKARVDFKKLKHRTAKKKITFFRCDEIGWPNPTPTW